MHKYYYSLLLLLIITSCATHKSKYAPLENVNDVPTTKMVSHTIYLIGDAGLSPPNEMNPALKLFKKRLDNAQSNSTAIFLGDNIYPAGMPDKKDDKEAYQAAKNNLDAQLNTLEDFSGKPIFIPGNHDWYTDGLNGLERQQDYIGKKLDNKKVFFPQDGCPIQKIDVSDDVVVIALDTEWYLTKWDKHPSMND
ncbi:MAG: hypothetical protein HKN53_05095 [Maribacter sp.]|nr:hypothetical protein [Maribacter sp.]